jgi:hypothetical protein
MMIRQNVYISTGMSKRNSWLLLVNSKPHFLSEFPFTDMFPCKMCANLISKFWAMILVLSLAVRHVCVYTLAPQAKGSYAANIALDKALSLPAALCLPFLLQKQKQQRRRQRLLTKHLWPRKVLGVR